MATQQNQQMINNISDLQAIINPSAPLRGDSDARLLRMPYARSYYTMICYAILYYTMI